MNKKMIGSRLLRMLMPAVLIGALVTGCGSKTQVPSAVSSEAPASQSVAAVVSEKESQPENKSEEQETDKERYVMVEITMQKGGVIKLELDREAAPLTVENFVELANDEFYDGLIFHRVIDGFMIQGGDPLGTGMGGPGHTVKGEFKANGWDNPIKHERGVISMARSQDPDSAGSQFFITNGDATFLDGNYAAFGRVVEGMDVVDRIAKGAVKGEAPVDPEIIETIRVVNE